MNVTLSRGQFGTYELVAEDGQDLLVQTDWDYPGIASNLGFVPCKCGKTDGTIDCEHKTASQMISEAAAFLDEHDGEVFEDPGYFQEGLTPSVFVRAGDSDDYNEFGDLSEAADYLHEMGARAPLQWHDKYGVSGPGFEGNNYISVYWAFDVVRPTAGLSLNEIADLSDALLELEGDYDDD
jgi:hypothetical protein